MAAPVVASTLAKHRDADSDVDENTTPMDATGWESGHFTETSLAGRAQRAVMAKGDIPNAAFMTVKLCPDAEDAVVRKAVGSFPKIIAQVGKHGEGSVAANRLVGLVAVAPALWTRWDATPPEELRPFVAKTQGNDPEGPVIFPAGDRDLFVMVKANSVDLCYEVTHRFLEALGDNVGIEEHTMGFRYMGGRDLTGFFDGSRNADFSLRVVMDTALIHPGDGASDAHAGGSYIYAGRYVHDLKKFKALSPMERSNIIGRHHDKEKVRHPSAPDVMENPHISKEELDPRAHIARGHGPMHRQAYPYRHESEQGLYFTASTRSLDEMDRTLSRMAGHYAKDKSIDNLMTVSRNVFSGYYYCPALPELKALAA